LGGVGGIEWLHEMGATLDAVHGEWGTPLQYAVRMGREDVALRLISLGVRVDVGDEVSSPLAQARARGIPRLVEALLHAGAPSDGAPEPSPPKLKPQPPRGAIQRAAARNDCEQLAELLANGAQVELADARGTTALGVAAAHDHADAVSLLLAHGARPDTASPSGLTPLALATLTGAARAEKLLRTAGAVDDVAAILATGNQLESIGQLISGLQLTRLAALLNDGTVDIDLPLRGGGPLARALLGKKVPAFEMLLDAGADPSIPLRGGVTCLMVAAELGQMHSVVRLLSAGADAHALTVDGSNAAGLAARRGEWDIMGLIGTAPIDLGHTIEFYTGKQPPAPRSFALTSGSRAPHPGRDAR
jgi:ankyrin repeat protein